MNDTGTISNAEIQFPRTRRQASASPAQALLFRIVAQLGMFLCGVLCWIGTPKYAKGDFVFTISPLQAGIPLLGVALLGWALVQYQARLPQFILRGLASNFLITGCLFILFGAGIHFDGGPLTQDLIVYLARWSMPFFCIVIFWVSRRMGGAYSAIFYGLLVGASISIAGVILARAGLNIPAGLSGDGRAAGFTAHPNQYGIIASGTAPFLVWLLLSHRRWQVLLGVVGIFLYGLVLYQSLSKTNLLLFPLALMMTFLAASLNRPAAFLRSSVAVVLLGFLFTGLAFVGLQVVREMSPRSAQVVEKSFEDPLNATSLEQREGAWEEVVQYLKIHPVAGLGPGWAESHLKFTHAHNLYLQMYVDSGLIGFIGIVLITLAVLLRCQQILRGILGIGVDLTEDARLQVCSIIALIVSLLGNSMSSSLSTGTMTAFVVILAISFTQQPPANPIPVTLPATRRRPVCA